MNALDDGLGTDEPFAISRETSLETDELQVRKKQESNPNEITVFSRKRRKDNKPKSKKGKCCSCERILTISFFTACFLRFCSILMSFIVFMFFMMVAQSRFTILQFWVLIGFFACVLAFQIAKLIESCSAGIVPEEEFLLDILWKDEATPLLWFQVRNDMGCCCGDTIHLLPHPHDALTSLLFLLAVPLLFPWDVIHDISEGCPRLFED